jgi:amidase
VRLVRTWFCRQLPYPAPFHPAGTAPFELAFPMPAVPTVGDSRHGRFCLSRPGGIALSNSRCYAISVERKRNTSSPLCRIDSSVSDLFGRAIDVIAGAGAMVDDAARPGIDEEEHHRLFELLLRAATASRMRDEDFSRQQEIAATLTDDDVSDRAAVARGATLSHRAWDNANEARTKLRYAWHEFFKRFDVLLTPVAATAAFPHDHNPNRDERTVSVNGKSVPYAEQLFFAGLASLSYLPATAAPIGLTGEGLPVGLQIVGPEGEDPTTIEFARLLAAEIGGFVPPPAYR